VYVKRADTDRPTVWVADDDGKNREKLGRGHSPAVSPDGRWVAWVAAGRRDRIMVARTNGRKKRRVARSAFAPGELKFSPDSTQLGMVLRSRLQVHDIPTRSTFTAASGQIRGFSFLPDSSGVVYGTAGENDAVDAPSDLYWIEFDAGPRQRITRERRSLYPLWGPDGIVHVRQRVRPGDVPSYNLFEIQPDGGSLRRITTLSIPSGVSGLVPVELSANGRRLLASFTARGTRVAFRVNPRTGRAKALDAEFAGADLSANGRHVLGELGGDVVRMPYRGGEPKVLVKRAAMPDWSL
jgi:Tol biopolymer transport system component